MGAGASVLRKKSRGSALLKATRSEDGSKIDEILAESPSSAGYCTLDGVSSLHLAAACRRADLLERLLVALRQAGTTAKPKAAQRAFTKVINQKNVHGQTPLMLACKAGSDDCVRLLLEAGADATLFDDLQQRTCLHYAALYGWAAVIDALLEDDVLYTTPDGQRQLLREAVIADSQGHHRYIDGRAGLGLAPLHLAASQGHLGAVKALLKRGACITVRCNIGFSLGSTEPWTPASTPLHFAAAGGKVRVVHAILQAAAQQWREGWRQPDVRRLQDFRGRRPFDVAAAMGHRSLLWALDPQVPLDALLVQPRAAPVVPTLAGLAAAALRAKLTAELAGLRQQAASRAGAGATPGGGGGSRRGSKAVSREGTAHGGSGYAAAAAGLASLQAAVASRLSFVGHSRQVSGHMQGSMRSMHRRHVSEGACTTHRHSFSGSGGHAGDERTVHGCFAWAAPGGSQRGGSAYAMLASSSAGRQQEAGGDAASPCAASPHAAASSDAAAAAVGGSGLSQCAGTSVTSCAGCPVCMDSGVEVAAVSCGHGLCLECAKHLCSSSSGGSEDCRYAASASQVPPLCPLCRAVMGGFTLLPAC